MANDPNFRHCVGAQEAKHIDVFAPKAIDRNQIMDLMANRKVNFSFWIQ